MTVAAGDVSDSLTIQIQTCEQVLDNEPVAVAQRPRVVVSILVSLVNLLVVVLLRILAV